MRHLAGVEHSWFQRVLSGRLDEARLFKRPDDRDWDFTGAVPDPAVVNDAFAAWRAQVTTADEWLDTLDEATLGHEVRRRTTLCRLVTLRRCVTCSCT